MATPLFAAEANGSRVYKVGRVGYDTGTQDVGGKYTGLLRTGKISPAGKDGLCYFRRVAVSVWRTGAYTATLKCWVDGVQTKTWDVNGNAVDQVVVISAGAPTTSPDVAVLEASIMAHGTYIEVEVTVDSDDVSGVFLPEEIEVHYLPIRVARSLANAESA